MNARRAGDRGWLLEVDDGDPAALAGALRAAFGARLQDVVPGHSTVLVIGDARLEELSAVTSRLPDPPQPVTVEIPVVYDGADLEEVAELTGLSVEEVLDRHAAPEYTAAFLGFQPGFAYLTGLEKQLVVPRRPQPRERVRGGSVAIAGPYTGIYPRDSPGGWRLIGHTDVALFDATRDPPALIQPGNRVRFVAR